MTPPADALLAGRYRRVRALGRGAMGEVWLAEDELLHRTVAIKTVLGTAEPGLVERIVREARLAARLNHPNAVAVHDLVVVDGRPHVVMEYVAGRTLADELRAHGGLPAARVRAIGAAIADALAEAHALGIVHRDVKPANVLLNERGVPKLADFGIARSTAASTTGGVLGTPAFVAPEIVAGASADVRSDVWSLGATLYAALAGRSPFLRSEDDNVYAVLHRIANEPVPPPPGDPATGAAIMTLLRAAPAERPTAAAIAPMLRAAPAPVPAPPPAQRTAGAPAEQTTQLPAPGKTRRKPAVMAALAAVLVAVAVLAVVLVVNSGGGDDNAAPPTRSSGVSTGAAPPTASYSAPGGVTVRGPAGWIADASAGIANVRDYRAPGSTDRGTGAYFRIGIANTRPADTIDKEAQGTRSFLLQGTDARILSSRTTTFLGSPAVDQEYTRTNSTGVARHLVIRLWFHAGRTLEIELDTPATEFAQRRAIFEQLITSCRVS